jgi:hypothetical protein
MRRDFGVWTFLWRIGIWCSKYEREEVDDDTEDNHNGDNGVSLYAYFTMELLAPSPKRLQSHLENDMLGSL